MTTLIVVTALVLYLLPATIACTRGHQHVVMIAVLNIFLGWTLLGWFGCLMWACSGPDRARQPSALQSWEGKTSSNFRRGVVYDNIKDETREETFTEYRDRIEREALEQWNRRPR